MAGRTFPLVFFFALLIRGAVGQAQPAPGFFRTYPDLAGSRNGQIQPYADGSFAVLMPDSARVLWFTACGALRRVRQYPGFGFMPGVYHSATPTPQKGLAWLEILRENSRNEAILNQIDSLGTPIRRIRLFHPDYSLFPYTLEPEPGGGFTLFANMSRVGGGESASLLVKISSQGQVQWARRYPPGAIWGGHIRTRDGGYCFRTGHQFVKTNALGQTQWAYRINLTGTDYYRPLETEEGFLLAGYNQGKLLLARFRPEGIPGPNPTLMLSSELGIRPIRSLEDGNFLTSIHPPGSLMPVLVRLSPTLQVVEARQTGEDFVLENAVVADAVPIGNRWLALLQHDDPLGPGKVAVVSFLPSDEAPCQKRVEIESAPGIDRVPVPVSAPESDFSLQAQVLSFTANAREIGSWGVLCREDFPAPGLPTDTVSCSQNLRLRLAAPRPGIRYTWSNGLENPELSVSREGTYWLESRDDCRLTRRVDSVRVRFRGLPDFPQTDTLEFCGNRTLVSAGLDRPGLRYRWSDPLCRDSVCTPGQNGRLDVQALDPLSGCQTQKTWWIRSCERLVWPNLITPDADLANNVFLPDTALGVADLRLQVFNRWGRPVHETEAALEKGWAAENVESGIYFWLATGRFESGRAIRQNGAVWVYKP